MNVSTQISSLIQSHFNHMVPKKIILEREMADSLERFLRDLGANYNKYYTFFDTPSGLKKFAACDQTILSLALAYLGGFADGRKRGNK